MALETVDALLAQPAAARAERKDSGDWKAWRKAALAALRLEDVYGEWLTGKSKPGGWLECRDPGSASGDKDPSAGVADGTVQAERGTFHSFISAETLSVFDFLVARGVVADFAAARRHVAQLSGTPLPGRTAEPTSVGEDQPAEARPEIFHLAGRVEGKRRRHCGVEGRSHPVRARWSARSRST